MQYIILCIKGVLLGIAAIIPGISIGTMALILDIYADSVESLTTLVIPTRWKSKQNVFSHLKFLVPIVISTIFSLIICAQLFSWLFDKYELFIRLMFVGLILGNIPYMFNTYIKPTLSRYTMISFLIGVVTIAFLSSNNIETTKNTIELSITLKELIIAFLMGIISSSAGVIPGISGSYLLLLLGYYSTFLNIMGNVILPLFIPFLIGNIIGLIGMAVLIAYLIKKFQKACYGIIFGMIVMSGIKIFPYNTVFSAVNSYMVGIILIACVLLGICVSFISTKIRISR